MKRKRISAEKIISILNEHEAGASAPDLSRRHGIVENTIYCWKSKNAFRDQTGLTRREALAVLNFQMAWWQSRGQSCSAKIKFRRLA